MHDTGAIKPMTVRAPAKARDWLIGLSLALWILPLLFSSTPSFIAWPRLAASLVALVLVRQAFPDGPGRPLAVLGGLLLAIY